jgi:hypothetical protein
MNMKHRLMIACLCSLPVGFSILSSRLTGAATVQSQQFTNQSEDVRTLMEVAIFPRQYFFPPRKFRDTFSLPAPVGGEGAGPNSWPVFVSE